jgi:hypothetical protein
MVYCYTMASEWFSENGGFFGLQTQGIAAPWTGQRSFLFFLLHSKRTVSAGALTELLTKTN